MTDELKFSAKAEYTGILVESWNNGELGPPVVRNVEAGREGEEKVTTPVCNFTLALKRSKDSGKLCGFEKITAWGSKAEKIATAGVGTWVTVKGYIYTDAWEDKTTGEKRYGKYLKLHDGDEALVIHGQSEPNNVVDQLTNELGGTVVAETNTSATPPPF